MIFCCCLLKNVTLSLYHETTWFINEYKIWLNVKWNPNLHVCHYIVVCITIQSIYFVIRFCLSSPHIIFTFKYFLPKKSMTISLKCGLHLFCTCPFMIQNIIWLYSQRYEYLHSNCKTTLRWNENHENLKLHKTTMSPSSRCNF